MKPGIASCLFGLAAMLASMAAATQAPSPRACDAARRSGRTLPGCPTRRPPPSPQPEPRTSPDLRRELQAHIRACDAGYSPGCSALAGMGNDGRRATPAMTRFLARMDQLCEGGDVSACVDAARFYAQHFGVPGFHARAVPLFRRACERGSQYGCYHLGLFYDLGEGVTADRDRAFQLYTQACQGGTGNACYSIGTYYQSGWASTRDPDYAQAIDYYGRACDFGSAIGCMSLASMYDGGIGIARDAAQVIRLTARACRLGYLNACAPRRR